MTDYDALTIAIAFDGAGEDERVRAAVAAWLADLSAFGRGLAQGARRADDDAHANDTKGELLMAIVTMKISDGVGGYVTVSYDDADPKNRNLWTASEIAVQAIATAAATAQRSADYFALRAAVAADPTNPKYRNLDLVWLGLA